MMKTSGWLLIDRLVVEPLTSEIGLGFAHVKHAPSGARTAEPQADTKEGGR
jgi:hypothetical protein